MPENIDALRELIMQDRQLTYRAIEVSLGISSTNIHSILHAHLAVKKIYAHSISQSLKKRFLPIGVKKSWKNTIMVPQKAFIRSSQAMNHGSMRMSSSLKTRQRNLFVEEAL